MVGATIAGGGGASNGASLPNTVSGNWGTVGGGSGNLAYNWFSTVAGGRSNTATGTAGTVGGGDGNFADADYATVAGGTLNQANGQYSMVPGGYKTSPKELLASLPGLRPSPFTTAALCGAMARLA